ncbi:hypothetical protein Hanom_Chr15g01400501 [Helianthus anomalus]
MWAPLDKKDAKKLVHGPKKDEASTSVNQAQILKRDYGSSVGVCEKNGPVKPSEKAVGLNLGDNSVLGSLGGSDPQLKVVDVTVSGVDGPGPVPALNGVDFPPLGGGTVGGLKTAVWPRPTISRKKYKPKLSRSKSMLYRPSPKEGKWFFDISKSSFGPRESPRVETKNSFDTLQNEEDCFDTDHGLWEKDMLMVRKFYETNTQPSDDVFKSWSEKLRAYYVMLTKFDPVNEAMVETKNEDEIEVESETDESARDIARGV